MNQERVFKILLAPHISEKATMVADQNPEGRAWKSTGIFGYTGRIPPKYITRVFTSWEPGQSMDDPEWNGTLPQFFQEWTDRYEGDPEEQEDENY
jgi:hypothetical protein